MTVVYCAKTQCIYNNNCKCKRDKILIDTNAYCRLFWSREELIEQFEARRVQLEHLMTKKL